MGGTNPNRPLKTAWVTTIYWCGIESTTFLEHQSFVYIRVLLSVRKSREPLLKIFLQLGENKSVRKFGEPPAENIKKKSDFSSNRRIILKHKTNFERVPAVNWGRLVKFAHVKFGGKEPVHQKQFEAQSKHLKGCQQETRNSC
nr:hypothetical protein CFP56_58315 [Quercus suber]